MLQVTQIPSGLFLLKIVSSFLFSYNLRTLEEDIHFRQIAFTSWPLFHLLLSNYLQHCWIYFLQTRPISFCKAKTICNNYVESSDITISHLLLLRTYLFDKKDLNQVLLKWLLHTGDVTVLLRQIMAEARRLTQVRTKRSGLVASSHLAGSFFPACFMFKCVAKSRSFWARQSLSKCLSAVYGPANSLPTNQIVHCSLLLYKYFIQGRNNCLFLEDDIFILIRLLEVPKT